MPEASAAPLKSLVKDVIPQLSETTGTGTITIASHTSGLADSVISPAQAIAGFSSSLIVTDIVQVDTFPWISVTVQVTFVVPTG